MIYQTVISENKCHLDPVRPQWDTYSLFLVGVYLGFGYQCWIFSTIINLEMYMQYALVQWPWTRQVLFANKICVMFLHNFYSKYFRFRKIFSKCSLKLPNLNWNRNFSEISAQLSNKNKRSPLRLSRFETFLQTNGQRGINAVLISVLQWSERKWNVC